MSASDDGDDEIPGREIAYRVFAAEYDDADRSYAESDEERAPNYVITPTGARLNRLFAVGTLTEVTSVNDEMVRARVVDPTGAFVVYAGQYQPDALATLEQLDPPAFVAVTGKARTFQPDDSDQVYTSIRPETIATVGADTRDRWVVSAAEQTLDRIGTYAAAAERAERGSVGDRAAEPRDSDGETLTRALEAAGVENGLASGLPIALDHYGTTAEYLAALRDRALEAVEVVAGDREQVSPLDIGPQGTSSDVETSFADLASLTDVALSTLDSIDENGGEADGAIAAAADETAAEPESSAESESAGTDDLGTGSAAGTASARLEGDESPESADAESVAADEAAGTAVEADDGGPNTSTEAAVDPETEPDTGSNDLGDFDAGDSTAVDAEASAESDGDEEAIGVGDDELGDFDGGDAGEGMYEMDEEEREQIEEEFGTEFTTGTEVDEPGESDIDVQATDDAAAAEESESEVADEAAPDGVAEGGDADNSIDEPDADESDADEPAEDEPTDEPPEDVDLQEYVVDTMTELDDGDGADRTALVETVADETGADESEVEDAIQDALMGGQCYEPDDETLKPI